MWIRELLQNLTDNFGVLGVIIFLIIMYNLTKTRKNVKIQGQTVDIEQFKNSDPQLYQQLLPLYKQPQKK